MSLHVVSLPGPLFLVPGARLAGFMQQKAKAHPHLPPTVPHVVSSLREINSQGGPAATVEPATARRDQSLLVYGRTFVMRLLPSSRHDAYTIFSVDPLRLSHHHRLAAGCLQLRTVGWELAFQLRRVPPGASAYWPQILAGWAERPRGAAARQEPPGPTARQESFLDRLGQLIDADERITMDAARSARPFAYREVRPTGERRRGSSPVYEFLMAGQVPEEGTFLQLRGQPEQRGQVTRAVAGSITMRFEQPVDWDHIPPQGQMEETHSSVVFAKQREAVALLRSGQARNPSLLSVIADRRTAPLYPASDDPAEHLDDDQLDAFRKAISVRDLMLVLGPPGTGKTRTISQIARACAFGKPEEREPGRVLVTSHTHRAVDNVLARLPRDLLVIRVGNVSKVTAEGQPYLLEAQAAELRGRIVSHTRRSLAAYADLETGRQWAGELARRAGTLRAVAGEEAQAHAHLEAAARAAGAPAQARVDALTIELQRYKQALSRNADRTDRLDHRRTQTTARAGWPLLGPVFGLLARRQDRRLAIQQAASDQLRAAKMKARTELDTAQGELDAATRDHPTVRAAAATLAEVAQRRDACRAAALEAAQACRTVIARMDAPPPVSADPPETAERQMAAFQAWLPARLPLLASRAKLLADWQAEAAGATSQLTPELIRYADVVAATCIGAASRPELSDVEFDMAIVDEAGQIGAANVLVPLIRARRGVLVGDDRQLPPYLDSAIEAWGAEIGDPVIQDLLTKSVLELLVRELDPASVVMLTCQRRMPAAIADFISAEFYGGRLLTGVRREHRDPLFRSPMAFIDTARLPPAERSEKSGREREQWGQPGYTNPAEAKLLAGLAAFYHRQGTEWAVIVPYRAQAAVITAALTPQVGNSELAELNVGTVDSFQGGERDVILYGFTRSNPEGRVGFLDELRRANVAFTRARHQLILTGDMTTLTTARDQRFRELARSMCAYLAERGDIRQYREITDRVAELGRLGGGQ